jgi:hypothetical protein
VGGWTDKFRGSIATLLRHIANSTRVFLCPAKVVTLKYRAYNIMC